MDHKRTLSKSYKSTKGPITIDDIEYHPHIGVPIKRGPWNSVTCVTVRNTMRRDRVLSTPPNRRPTIAPIIGLHGAQIGAPGLVVLLIYYALHLYHPPLMEGV